MATINEIEKIWQLSYSKKMLEEAKNHPYVNHILRKCAPPVGSCSG